MIHQHMYSSVNMNEDLFLLLFLLGCFFPPLALGNMCNHSMFWQALTSATCLTAVSKAVSSSMLSLLHKDNITIKCEIKRPFREQWHLLEVCLLPQAEAFKLTDRTFTGSIATLCFPRERKRLC